MAFSFGGANGAGRVNVGQAASLDDINTGTVLAWVYPTGTSSVGVIYWKGPSSGAGRQLFQILTTPALNVIRSRATTNLIATAATANFSAWGLNKWLLVGGVWDTAGVAADQRLYVGDLATAAAEPSTYSAQNAGAGGNSTNDTNDALIGNNPGFANGFVGRIAVVAIWSAVLTAAQIASWQWNPRPRVDNLLAAGYWECGLDPWGATSVPDMSGNGNTGTPTSVTVEEHAPIWRFLAARQPRHPDRRMRPLHLRRVG